MPNIPYAHIACFSQNNNIAMKAKTPCKLIYLKGKSHSQVSREFSNSECLFWHDNKLKIASSYECHSYNLLENCLLKQTWKCCETF